MCLQRVVLPSSTTAIATLCLLRLLKTCVFCQKLSIVRFQEMFVLAWTSVVGTAFKLFSLTNYSDHIISFIVYLQSFRNNEGSF